MAEKGSIYYGQEIEAKLKKSGDRGEASRLTKPLKKNPTDCATYEEIISSPQFDRVAHAKPINWVIAFMHLMNSIHIGHNNPANHKR